VDHQFRGPKERNFGSRGDRAQPVGGPRRGVPDPDAGRDDLPRRHGAARGNPEKLDEKALGLHFGDPTAAFGGDRLEDENRRGRVKATVPVTPARVKLPDALFGDYPADRLSRRNLRAARRSRDAT
jgi:hypothetical protein